MCQDCQAARISPAYRRYDPLCLWCGACYVKQLRQVDVTPKAREDWRKRVMALWESFGHERSQLRELAMGEKLPYAPAGRGSP